MTPQGIARRIIEEPRDELFRDEVLALCNAVLAHDDAANRLKVAEEAVGQCIEDWGKTVNLTRLWKWLGGENINPASIVCDEALAYQWVSVDERLPEPYVPVWIFPPPTDYCREGEVNTNGQWSYAEYETGFGNVAHECKVTHWMPLPAPPTDSKEVK